MYYVLKVGDKYLGFSIGDGPTLSDRQRDAVRFDAPSFKPIEGWLNLRFVKVVPRLSPADVLPDVHADIDANTRESDDDWDYTPF